MGLTMSFMALTPDTALAQANTREITVTIRQIKVIDKPDAFSKADFYARVTIDGNVQTTQRVRQSDNILPNWAVSARVPQGRRNVKLEIFDKDVSVDDAIDVNRVDAKRDLDFTVDTRRCRVEGFSTVYRCGEKILRAGKERKAAEVTFHVDVK